MNIDKLLDIAADYRPADVARAFIAELGDEQAIGRAITHQGPESGVAIPLDDDHVGLTVSIGIHIPTSFGHVDLPSKSIGVSIEGPLKGDHAWGVWTVREIWDQVRSGATQASMFGGDL